MPKLRVALYSLLGFTVPIFIAVTASPFLFPKTAPRPTAYERARLEEAQETSASSMKAEPAEPQEPFATIVSDESLDPVAGKSFVINMLVRVNRLPEVGKRQRIVFKYEIKKPPYEGWAFAMNHLPTSVRPEFYWRDEKGKGGWHTFEEVNLEVGAWYTFSAVVTPTGYLSLYYSNLRQVDPFSPGTQSPLELQISADAVQFLGGYDVSGIVPPQSDDRLFARAGGPREDGFFVDVAELFIGRGRPLPANPRELKALLAGGAHALAAYLDRSNVSLLLDNRGRDLSKFGRNTAEPALAGSA